MAYFDLDEPSGTTVTSSINSITGTTAGTVGSEGINNYCETFASNFINIPNVSYLTLTGNMSFSIWVYPTTDPPSQDALFVHKGTYPYNYRLTYSTNQNFGFALGLGGTFTEIKSPNSYDLNNWYHVVATYDTSAGQKLYVNGNLVASGTTTGTVTTNTGNLYVGSYYSTGYKYSGRLDEFAIFDKVLTPTEVSYLYNSGTGRFY